MSILTLAFGFLCVSVSLWCKVYALKIKYTAPIMHNAAYR